MSYCLKGRRRFTKHQLCIAIALPSHSIRIIQHILITNALAYYATFCIMHWQYKNISIIYIYLYLQGEILYSIYHADCVVLYSYEYGGLICESPQHPNQHTYITYPKEYYILYKKYDRSGVRTHALSDCGLNAAPQTTRPSCQ